MPAGQLTFVPDFIGKVYELAMHPFGYRVIQKLLEHLSEELSRPLLEELHRCARHLMQDAHGVCV